MPPFINICDRYEWQSHIRLGRRLVIAVSNHRAKLGEGHQVPVWMNLNLRLIRLNNLTGSINHALVAVNFSNDSQLFIDVRKGDFERLEEPVMKALNSNTRF